MFLYTPTPDTYFSTIHGLEPWVIPGMGWADERQCYIVAYRLGPYPKRSLRARIPKGAFQYKSNQIVFALKQQILLIQPPVLLWVIQTPHLAETITPTTFLLTSGTMIPRTTILCLKYYVCSPAPYLDVWRILVALLKRHGQLLRDPDLHLVNITRELLEVLHLSQLGAVLQQLLLQTSPAVQHLVM